METAIATIPAAHTSPTAPGDAGHNGQQTIHHSAREKVPWPKEIWDHMDREVHEESLRVRVGAKFLNSRPVHPKTTSVPPQLIEAVTLAGDNPGAPAKNDGTPATPAQVTLTVDEGLTIRLNEIWTEFALTPQQVHETAEAKDPRDCIAVTLARRSAQYLSLAQDYVIFQGVLAYNTGFFEQNIRSRPGQLPADLGMLGFDPQGAQALNPNIPLPPTDHFIPVPQVTPAFPGVIYGQNTFLAVEEGYSVLNAYGHTGEYALILHTIPYADLFAPVGTESLAITADRVAPLVKAGIHSTGTLPSKAPSITPSPIVTPPTYPVNFSTATTTPPAAVPTPVKIVAGNTTNTPNYYGLLVSLGGDTMDLVVGHHTIVTFMQQDPDDNWRFRVLERFAFRLKDPTAVVVLGFL